MTIDPFETAPVDNNQNTTDNNNTDSKESNTMNNQIVTDQDKIVVTLKGGSGFDAPWIVVHANDAVEAHNTLKDKSMEELVNLASSVGKAFAATGSPANKRGGGQSNGKPAGAAQAPNGQEPPEGYEFKSGVSKKGKAWKAFMPLDRDAGLEVIWL